MFVHPINKWKEIKSFQQLKLMANALAIKTHTEFEVISIQQIWATESCASLNRSPVFLNWRLSRDLGYKVIRNMKTGAITVYKHFEGELDLLCILNCQNPDQYQSELKELLNHFCNSDSHFGGLNIFHTFARNSFIESDFISIPLVHRRFLCGRTEGRLQFR